MHDLILLSQQHQGLTIALVVVLFLLVIVEWIKIRRGAHKISTTEAVSWINHKHAKIIDIRKPDAFATGHILNSMSIPLIDLEKNIKKLDKFKSHPIIIVCAMGIESNRAVEILKKKGFTDAHILAGGIRAWTDANMPLAKN